MKSGGLVVGAMLWLAVVALVPPVLAGDLNPPGPPGPTMKTLDEIPGSWHRILPASERFVLVMSNLAVLDKETGLVWEKSPDGIFNYTWVAANMYCLQKTLGGRKGWRLPTVEELASLIDPSVPSPAATLPAGHPFTNVQSSLAYWSATTSPSDTSHAWWVSFSSGIASPGDKAPSYWAWCARGGRGHNGL